MYNAQQQIFPGLKDPVIDSQDIFRKLLSSMSEPGLISQTDVIHYHPSDLHPATYGIALSLFDQGTKIKLAPSLDHTRIITSLRFHNSVQTVTSYKQAGFVLCNEDDRPELSLLNKGNESYPDQSCTLIIQSQSFNKGIIYRATGPGIENSRKIRCSALNGTLVHQRDKLLSRFPLGIDIIFTCGNDFFCLPRTTRLISENH